MIIISYLIIENTMRKKQNFFLQEINPKVLQAEYAVRGAVPIKAGEIEADLRENPEKYPFGEMTYCNIGNPQAFRQPPISFNREVISCVVNPSLLESNEIHEDVKKRARWFLEKLVSAGSYTHSMGIAAFRESVAKFIQKKDKVPRPSIDHIFLTEGASQGVHMLLSMLICSKEDGIMIPIPQYPLYSASIALNGGTAVPYYLDEESGWQLQPDELQKSLDQARSKGVRVRCLCVINPGNPTGAIFSEETIRNVIRFAVENRLVLIADEVYRENIYKEGARFHSMRSVLEQMEPQYRDSCEIASLHSVSKGIIGECGLRGGYIYIHNFSEKARAQFLKLKSISLCSNTIGQMSVEMMCNPPVEGVAPETREKYLKETKALFDSLRNRAQILTRALNSMRNVHSQEVEGAMYAFPSVRFSEAAIKAAGGKPDLFYCMEALRATGIVLVPGSGFEQRAGTYHFRTTLLIRPDDKLEERLRALKKFNNQFHARYDPKPSL